MFCCTPRRLTVVTDTCLPTNFVHATDLAFYFPRFQPRAHLRPHGIPELQDAVALLQPAGDALQRRWSKPRGMGAAEWGKCRDKALGLLFRGEEIMENVGGLKNFATADILRSTAAVKFELLNGVEHLPRSDCAKRCDVYRSILKQASYLLFFNDSWDKSDVQQIDTACVIVAHFVRAFCALYQMPFHAKQEDGVKKKYGNISAWSVEMDEVNENGEKFLTSSMVMDRIEELLKLSRKAAETHAEKNPELRWHVPKLLLLKGVFTIPLTGHLGHAQECINESAKLVYESLRRKQPILDDILPHKQEPELGLFMLAQAEMTARVFDWSVGPNKVDKSVIEMFEAAAKFYSSPCNTSLEADGIMSADGIEERRFETDAYISCLLSYANFLLNAPRPPGTSRRDFPVFMPKQLFTMSPISIVSTSSDTIFTDVQNPVTMSVDVVRRRTGETLERALKLNRILYPDHKQNPKAGWTLLAMASLYADMRDYLYATGLFSSAEKALVENYGNYSLERLLALKLRYEFLAGVGSDQEAKTVAHEVVHVLKHIDSMPLL
ncbi:hypothetical protein TraAM80_03622 [Trypanosoma rangeli]|uniref:Uncharacterized protein n=1 Tax=Trypanosoma rangeli TaxID=5698 RepID=A0A422NMG4_TRYRA|nr:uncharacterized protein TraAM80_03622 [Trypanosoma rangeli]RNF06677.1 hypothetical protein TraAM80_03622 [Trypanosoma rangeli]|eukprot:RNF06677.1 hypothetical protein TraAM80_03622 [Trypanosoma rangeli]